MFKKTVSVLLAVMLVCGLVPLSAVQTFAAGTGASAVGTGSDPVLTLGQSTTVVFHEGDPQEATYAVTAPAYGAYRFYTEGDRDTRGYLINAAGDTVAYNDDFNSDRNFCFSYALNAGETYYLTVNLYSFDSEYDNDGNITFTLFSEAVSFADSLAFDEGGSYRGFADTMLDLHAAFSPNDAVQETLTWTSSNSAVAELSGSENQSRTVLLKAGGTAVITAAAPSGLQAQMTVTVLGLQDIGLGETKNVTLTENENEVRFHFTAPESRRYVFYATGGENTPAYCTYGAVYGPNESFIDDSAATNFRVVAKLTAGETYSFAASIPYWYSNRTGSYQVTLEAMPRATSVSIDQGSTLSGYSGYYLSLTTQQQPEGAEEDVTWESSDDSIIFVNIYGDAYFSNEGTATVTVTTENGKSDSIVCTVKPHETLTLGSTAPAVIPNQENYVLCDFTPEVSGTYLFSSVNAPFETYAEVRDAYNNMIGSGCSDDGNDFTLRCDLTGGETYCLRTSFSDDVSTGAYTVKVVKAASATGLGFAQGSAVQGEVENTIRLEPVFTPEGASVEDVVWSSSDDSIVSVDSDGLITLLRPGTATVTATSARGLTASCAVTVKSIPTIAAGETKTISVDTGGMFVTYQFVPSATGDYRFFSQGEYDTYGYLFDADMDQIDYDDDGGGNSNFSITHSLTAGETYYVRARMYRSYETGSFTLTVQQIADLTGVAVAEGSAVSGYPLTESQLHVMFLPAGALSEGVTWSSSNETVVSVNTWDGTLSFNAVGTATVTVTSDSGFTDSVTVTVKDYDAITPGVQKNVTLNSGDYVLCRFIPAETGYYSFRSVGSGDTQGAVFDSDMYQLSSSEWGGEGDNFYLDYQFAAGETYYLKACFSDGEASGSFGLLLEQVAAATAVAITADTLTGVTGSTLYLNAALIPDSAPQESVSWSSSDENVAVVNHQGEVILLAEGTAVITVTTASGLTDSVTVTVTDYLSISPGETKPVTVGSPGASVMYRFVPAQTGQYVFYSTEGTGLRGVLYDDSMRLLNSVSGSKIEITRTLTAGRTYYFEGRFSDDTAVGSYTVSLLACPEAQEISISCGNTLTGYAGTSAELTVTFLPQYAVRETLSWQSDQPAVADIDHTTADGATVLFKQAGTATLTAYSDSGLSTSVAVTVKSVETLADGETKTAVISNAGGSVLYRVTPGTDGCYAFYSSSNADTRAELYNASMESLADDDDSGVDNNFRLRYIMTAGSVYYLQVSYFGSQTGSFPVTMEETAYVTQLELLSAPVKTVFYEGSVSDYIDYSGLSVKATWSDGEETVWTYGEPRVMRGESVDLRIGNAALTVSCGGKSVSCTFSILENPVDSIEVTGSVFALIENTGGSWEYAYGTSGRYYHYDIDDLGDIEVTVHYKNGSTAVTYVGETLGGYEVLYKDTQAQSPWSVGVNQLTVSYLGCTAAANVTVTESPVASIELLETPAHLIENNNGDFRTRTNPVTGAGESFFYYYLDALSGVSVRVTFKDGTTAEGTTGSSLNGYRVTVSADQYNEPLTVGVNEVTVEYMGAQAPMSVTVEENPVQSVTLLSPSANTLYENAGGYWTTRYSDGLRFYHYELSRLDDALVQITFKDGSVVSAHPYDSVRGATIWNMDDQYDHPFTLGSNAYQISYMGVTASAAVTVAPNPVASVEVLDDYSMTVIEEAEGFRSTRSDGSSFFYYSYSYPFDATVRITYTDGSSVTAHPGDSINDYTVSLSDDQFDSPWTPGGSNVVTVDYMGKTAAIPVVIAPNPVASIQVIQSTAVRLYENTDGYYETDSNGESYFYYTLPDVSDAVIRINYTNGLSATAHPGDKVDGYRVRCTDNQTESYWMRGSDNYVTLSYMGRETQMPIAIVESPARSLTVTAAPSHQYLYGDEFYGGSDWFQPSDYTGLAFTVTYKDGSQKSFTDADIDADGKIDGHRFTVGCDTRQHIGNMPVTLNYMGVSAVYDVTVVENHIADVSVVRLPDVPVYSRYYTPNWSGMQIKVTDTNGSETTVTLNDSNTIYGFNGNMGYYTGVAIGGTTAVIYTRSVNDRQKQFFLSVAGCECEITGLTYRTDKTVTAVQVEDFTPTGENMLVRATYEDGTTESFRLTDVKDSSIGWIPEFYYVRAMTDKGLLSFQITTPQGAEYNNFDLLILEQQVRLDAPAPQAVLGDVTGDGAVTIADATRIQRYLAEFSVPDPDLTEAYGDVTGDGVVNIKDVTAIQRYLADLENPYHIGSAVSA